jgi:hypothetical protein
MMKTTRIAMLAFLMVSMAQWMQAQTKIGTVRSLEIGSERLLEMQAKLGEMLIVTDSLEFGITTLDNANTTNPGDAMMLKLFGYGLGNFATEEQTYFLGTNTSGQVLEFPLSLDLDVSIVPGDTSALLSLFSIDTFGTVDLLPLDDIFATDQNLLDSITRLENTLTNIVNQDRANDLDTIQTNELIHEIRVIPNDDTTFVTPGTEGDGQQTTLVFFEDRFIADVLGRPDERAFSTVDLHTYFPTFQDVNDTADVLRGNIFYLSDGEITSDRTVTGASGTRDLTFTEMDSLTLSANNTTITSSADTDLSSTGSTSISADGDVDISGTKINLDAPADTITATGTLNLSEYPSLTTSPTFQNILGIDPNGNVINVEASSILGTENDSTIYTHNGTLISERYMTMDAYNLNFVNSNAGDTVVISNDGRMAIGTGVFTPNSTGPNPSDVRLEVAGDILAERLYSSSDRRFKKDIMPIESALRKVMAINGVTYHFKSEKFKNKKFSMARQVGFIAQEVEEVLPEVVNTDGHGYKSVDYAKITALLNEAIKEQQEQISQQQQLIQAQQAMINNLNQQFAQINERLDDQSSATASTKATPAEE